MNEIQTQGLIIVHIGAGSHSQLKTGHYKKLIKRALQVPESERSLLESSEKLEKSPLTNTGYGSSLNLLGKVQCDASFIRHNRPNNKTEMGSMYNITKHYPISETIRCFEQLNKLYSEGFRSFGLSQPIIFDYAQKEVLNNISRIEENLNEDPLVSLKAQKIFDIYRAKLTSNLIPQAEEVQAVRSEIQDTIGIIHINDKTTEIATSSGGNFFKFPGRIGCAGILGAAIAHCKRNGISVSCMCSGNGEDIIIMNLANRIAEQMVTSTNVEYCETLTDIIVRSSMDMPLTAVDSDNKPIIYVGALCVIHNLETDKKHLAYSHSTESFYFGFKSQTCAPEIVLSRLDSTKVGRVFARGEFKI